MKIIINKIIFNAKSIQAKKSLILYHGTSDTNAKKVKSSGLTNKIKTANWFMLSDAIDDAIWHSDRSNGKPVVIVFEIPIDKDAPWEGHPYIFPGEKAMKGTWYAPMDNIHSKFIKKIIKISDKELKRVKDGN